MDIDWEIFLELHKDMPRQGVGRDIYTQQAYEMIPKISKPRILDVGCGTGMQTITLAKLSDGDVIGIDIIDQYLDQFKALIQQEQLGDRVKAVKQSMTDIRFPKEYFDIMWAEGSIFIMGFEQGLIEWKKYLKPQGYLAIHDMAWFHDDPPQEVKDFWQTIYPAIDTVETNLDIIKRCGYQLLGHFPLPEDAWWEFYYNPLQKRIEMLKRKWKDNQKGLDLIKAEEYEIEMFKKYNAWYGSVFYVMQKE